MSQKNYKPHYEHLKNKWTDRQKDLQRSLWEKHKEALDWLVRYVPTKQHLISGTMGGLLLFSSPHQAHAASLLIPFAPEVHAEDLDKEVFAVSDLLKALPQEVRPLTPEEEVYIGKLLSDQFDMKVSAELHGNKLNRSYGLIGQEQHLARFPGDNMTTHFDDPSDSAKFGKYGMAPGLGAWGYFAPSRAAFTQEDNMREKYYLAVQTFLSPGWGSRTRELYNFFKFRKMLVVNPHNGRAVVAVIGDAGPAQWTGKHLGGSPEVMTHLQRVDGRARGPVLYFFIDDPDNQIPLGPVEMK
jgi:hypothetical protein